MVNQLQFLAVGAFLLWGLASALCDVLLRGSMADPGIHVDHPAD